MLRNMFEVHARTHPQIWQIIKCETKRKKGWKQSETKQSKGKEALRNESKIF